MQCKKNSERHEKMNGGSTFFANDEKVLFNTWNLEQPSKVKLAYLLYNITKRMPSFCYCWLHSSFVNNVVNLLLAILV
jgi:hypothetical protein